MTRAQRTHKTEPERIIAKRLITEKLFQARRVLRGTEPLVKETLPQNLKRRMTTLLMGIDNMIYDVENWPASNEERDRAKLDEAARNALRNRTLDKNN
jgi:hypothetical protein